MTTRSQELFLNSDEHDELIIELNGNVGYLISYDWGILVYGNLNNFRSIIK